MIHPFIKGHITKIYGQIFEYQTGELRILYVDTVLGIRDVQWTGNFSYTALFEVGLPILYYPQLLTFG